MGERFTLKPRFGSSGRGRVAGRRADTPAVRGRPDPARRTRGRDLRALARAVGRISRCHSSCHRHRHRTQPKLRWPRAARSRGCSARSRCSPRRAVATAVIAARSIREAASSPATRRTRSCAARPPRSRSGPGRADSSGPAESTRSATMQEERLRLRGAVEFNARSTMGLVTIGLVRRALPLVRRGPRD